MKNILFATLILFHTLNVNVTLINIFESDSELSSLAQSQVIIDKALAADTTLTSKNIFFSDAGYHRASFPLVDIILPLYLPLQVCLIRHYIQPKNFSMMMVSTLN